MEAIDLNFKRNEVYAKTMRLIEQCCIKNEVDNSHGLSHAIDIANHVYKAIQSISEEQKLSETQAENIMLAAFLHDIDDRKYFNTNNYRNARQILSNVVERQQRKQQIIKMIDLVAFSKNGNRINPQHPSYYYIPRYADRLDAIGLIGLWRCYQYSFRVKKPMFLQKTPIPQNKEQIYQIMKGRDQIYIKNGGKSESIIDHMFDKILHIKLPIKNPYLQSLYQQGHNNIVDFILQNANQKYKNAEKNLLEKCQKYR